jgi:hypothetical protein
LLIVPLPPKRIALIEFFLIISSSWKVRNQDASGHGSRSFAQRAISERLIFIPPLHIISFGI